jgi:glutamine cyclotransferase
MKIHVLMVLIVGIACVPENLLSSLGTEKHDSGCYSQGLSFLNESHLMESCGWYNGSYFHLYRYEQEPFTLEEVWKSQKPY